MEYRYKVGMIDGDYAHLYRIDDGSNDEITVAMALLPEQRAANCFGKIYSTALYKMRNS